MVTSVLCRLTQSQPTDAWLPTCPWPWVSFPLIFCGPEGYFQSCVLRCFGEALSSLSLGHPLPEDSVTFPAGRGQLLHNPESIEFSQKCLIKMLTLEIYSAVGIASLCAGQDDLNPHSQETLLMVHGDTLCV